MFQKILLLVLGFTLCASPAFAVWIWTPQSNRWVNPKYAVRDTPAEQLGFALEFFNNKEYVPAVRELQKLIRHYPKSREAADAQFYTGVALEQQGKLKDAFAAYQKVIDMYPFSERAPEIVKLQFALGERMLQGEGDKGVLGRVIGASEEVVDVFEAVIKNAPYGPLAPEARYQIGLYLLENQLYQEARDAFTKVIHDYPESPRAKAAEFQIAYSDSLRSVDAQYDQEITKAAVEGFEEYLKSNAKSELSDRARENIAKLREKEAENNFVIARFYEGQKNFHAARIYYQVVADDYRDTTWARKALEKIREVGAETKGR
jgi:outer membrane assembly lipoprotein YfiO